MARAGRDDEQVATSSPSSPLSSSSPRTALILYGSETGNAQDVAEEVGRVAERLRFTSTVVDMDSVQLRDLLKHTVVVFALSTTGQGEMPQNARAFWKTLLSGALRPGVLRKLRFSSFGLGDSSYARYNVAHRMLCGRLVQLGGQMFCERGEGNEQHPEGHSAGLREWIVALKQRLLDTFPLVNGLSPLADDSFLEPKWKLGLVARDDNPKSTQASANRPHLNGSEASPSTDLLPVRGSHRADIVANERVTAADHFQDVRLMDLRVDDPWSYGPGAIAVIYPKNFPQDVEEFVHLMGWEEIVDQPLRLEPSSPGNPPTDHLLSPLRHLDLQNIPLTMRWLLENVLDIMSIPRRTFFAELAHFVAGDSEDEQYQKERLLELANPELIDELWDYTTRPKRTILEVMMDFTTVKIPWPYALSLLPLMKGRQFSIASGGRLARDAAAGRTRLQLLVAIADPPSPIIKWRRRYGVCTRYIATLRAGQALSLGLQQGYLDVRPGELAVPVVMVGPGTGLAPMRALVQQRLAWAQEETSAPVDDRRSLQGDILLFGCRASAADYFFRDEWEHLQRDERLTLLVAFSRDPQHPKQYVQDQIRANGARIVEALVRQNGKVFVCGSSGNMPKGVRRALLDVLVAEGAVETEEAAEGYLDGMEKGGRYKQETW